MKSCPARALVGIGVLKWIKFSFKGGASLISLALFWGARLRQLRGPFVSDVCDSASQYRIVRTSWELRRKKGRVLPNIALLVSFLHHSVAEVLV